MHITPELLKKSLEGQGTHSDTPKQRIKANIARVNSGRGQSGPLASLQIFQLAHVANAAT
jgi:hypothetical protein